MWLGDSGTDIIKSNHIKFKKIKYKVLSWDRMTNPSKTNACKVTPKKQCTASTLSYTPLQYFQVFQYWLELLNTAR